LNHIFYTALLALGLSLTATLVTAQEVHQTKEYGRTTQLIINNQDVPLEVVEKYNAKSNALHEKRQELTSILEAEKIKDHPDRATIMKVLCVEMLDLLKGFTDNDKELLGYLKEGDKDYYELRETYKLNEQVYNRFENNCKIWDEMYKEADKYYK